ncbi:receptor-like protein 56 [Impatiens glandulifera]|uniref:receptor-like protein 56 n=1 Tax=Impatiens glandulifera TaxID=253017 RepID=UPI001FB153DF|nr:receptor-like protein 56 [Impatiens glandulifera]
MKLKKLEDLFLIDNSNDIDSSYQHKKVNLSCLGSLPFLRKLSLSGNYFMDDHNFLNEVLESIQQIEELDLSYCNLTSKGGGVMRSFSKKMVKLRILDLSYNNLQKDVLATLGALPSLQFLQLSYNPSIEGPLTNQDLIGFHRLEILNLAGCRLKGSIPKNLCKMNKLQELDLSNNLLQGDIPICLNELSLLENFNIQNNQLNGNISSSLFRDLNSLKYIDLRDNSLQGSFSLRTFANFSKLEHVLINSYNDKLVIESDVVDWVPKFQLQTLMLYNCNLKEFPKFLLYQKNLGLLNLSHNKVEGSFPDWLLVNNTRLFVLSLRDNSLCGNIFSNLFNWSTIRGGRNIEFIDISYNNMSGQIPITSTNRSIVDILSMRGNSFSGLLSCQLVGFYYLDISYNSFSGDLPACTSFKDLTHLNLYGNKFTGLVPETILNSSTLLTLNIGNNFFFGRIPTHLINDNFDLQVLSLTGNCFSGTIPHELCQLKRLNWLDLSHNSFSGSIPTCLSNIGFGKNTNTISGESMAGFPGASTFTLDYMADVMILTKYRVDSYTGMSLELMSGLDLSCNNLQGDIPNVLGNLSVIHALNLSHNWLSGPIPQTFSNLIQIESLDLSHNNLSGEIPSNLVNLNFMGTFSVAYNNLSGRLPDMKGQFATFKGDSYTGNPFLLCGPPLEKDCKVKNDDNDDDELHDDDHEAWYTTIDRDEFYASFMATYIVYILGFIAVLWINNRWRNRWFNFIDNILFSTYYFLSDALYKCFRIRI